MTFTQTTAPADAPLSRRDRFALALMAEAMRHADGATFEEMASDAAQGADALMEALIDHNTPAPDAHGGTEGEMTNEQLAIYLRSIINRLGRVVQDVTNLLPPEATERTETIPTEAGKVLAQAFGRNPDAPIVTVTTPALRPIEELIEELGDDLVLLERAPASPGAGGGE